MKKKTKRTARTKSIQIRVSTHELRIFQEAANKAGSTLSSWCRERCVTAATKELGLIVVAPAKTAYLGK